MAITKETNLIINLNNQSRPYGLHTKGEPLNHLITGSLSDISAYLKTSSLSGSVNGGPYSILINTAFDEPLFIVMLHRRKIFETSDLSEVLEFFDDSKMGNTLARVLKH